MRHEIEITPYDRKQGIAFEWDQSSKLVASGGESGVSIKGDREGLEGLARVLLTLAQADVPPGAHVHLDEFVLGEIEGAELLIERLDG